MNPRPNAKIEFLCNGVAVCSIDEERGVTVPLENFDFPPIVGLEIFLDGHWDTPRLCPCDDLCDRHPLRESELDGSLPFAGSPVR